LLSTCPHDVGQNLYAATMIAAEGSRVLCQGAIYAECEHSRVKLTVKLKRCTEDLALKECVGRKRVDASTKRNRVVKSPLVNTATSATMLE
jgi:hypothetical protein